MSHRVKCYEMILKAQLQLIKKNNLIMVFKFPNTWGYELCGIF